MKHVSPLQAIMWIILSTLIITPATYTGVRALQKKHYERHVNPQYAIRSIIHTGTVKRGVSSVFLVEALGLSVDRSTNLYRFDLFRGKYQLEATGVIHKIRLKKYYPNKLYIDYELRIPYVQIGDYDNLAIDEQGIAFPHRPVFLQKRLSKIQLGGCQKAIYGEPFHHPRLAKALEIYQMCKERLPFAVFIDTVDVSLINSQSLGEREIVVTIEEGKEKHYLRLTPKNCQNALGNYFSLRRHLKEELWGKIIDLRIENVAYLEEI